jgi:hypothetical protein
VPDQTNSANCHHDGQYVSRRARAGSARAAASFPRLPAFRQFSYFDPIIVSGDLGYRKPDRRLFQLALDGMKVAPQDAMYVGNDMHRDIFGAREAGLTTVMVDFRPGQEDIPGLRPRLHDHRSSRAADDPPVTELKIPALRMNRYTGPVDFQKRFDTRCIKRVTSRSVPVKDEYHQPSTDHPKALIMTIQLARTGASYA